MPDRSRPTLGTQLRELREECGLAVATVARGVRLRAPYVLDDIEAGHRRITRDQFEHMVERICIQSCQPDLLERGG